MGWKQAGSGNTPIFDLNQKDGRGTGFSKKLQSLRFAFSRKTEKQKAKLSAIKIWVFRREGAAAHLGPS